MSSKRSQMLESDPIGKTLAKLSIPAIIGMSTQAIYNLVDTIFVGRGVGKLGIGGITIVFPVQIILSAIGIMIGIGGASLISRQLGAHDKNGAARTLGNMMTLSLTSGFLTLVIGLYFMRPILKIFGVTDSLMPYSIDYFKVIVLGAPFISFSISSSNAVRAEGNAKVAMFTLLIGAFLNIVLDPIFIFGFNMGVRGAAIATVLSQFCSSIFLYGYFQSGKSEIHFHIKYFPVQRKIVSEILTIGFSAFIRQAASSFTIAIVNNKLGTYGGDTAISAFGITFRVISFLFMPLFGINQGAQPIIGYNYGAEQYERVRKGFTIATLFSTVISVIGFLLCLLFPIPILRLFVKDEELIAMSSQVLFFITIFFPSLGFQIIGSGLFQSIGKAIPALILSLARQVIFLIPLVLLLPHYFQLNGIWYSFPISDGLALVLTIILVGKQMKKLSNVKQKISLENTY